MRIIVPSVIVKYIDLKFTEVKRQQENNNVSCFMTKEQSPIVISVLTMVDAIPEYLVVLEDLALAEYFEAVASIRHAVTIWDTGASHTLTEYPGSGHLNPFTILRKHLETFHDEGVESSTNALSFIEDSDFRELLRRDITAVSQSFSHKEWKAVTVLGGSVVEAFLLYALHKSKNENISQFNSVISTLKLSGELSNRLSGNPNKWNLDELTKIANKLSIIRDKTAEQCKIAKDFRNLIHPGRAARLVQKCNRGTAYTVLAAIEFVMHDLTRDAL